jgi:hypothetical protein
MKQVIIFLATYLFFINMLCAQSETLIVFRHADDFNSSGDWDFGPYSYMLPDNSSVELPWIRLNEAGLERADLIGQNFTTWLSNDLNALPLGHVITRDPVSTESTQNPFSTIWPTIDQSVNTYVTDLPVSVTLFNDLNTILDDINNNGMSALFPQQNYSTLVCMTWQNLWGFDNNGTDTFDPGLFLGSIAPTTAFIDNLGKPSKGERMYVFKNFNNTNNRFDSLSVYDIQDNGTLSFVGSDNTLSNEVFIENSLLTITYPNPTTDDVMLTITDRALTNLSYSLIDIQGKVLSNVQITESDTQIRMQHLTTGMYILKLNQNNQALKTFKIIKK